MKVFGELLNFRLRQFKRLDGGWGSLNKGRSFWKTFAFTTFSSSALEFSMQILNKNLKIQDWKSIKASFKWFDTPFQSQHFYTFICQQISRTFWPLNYKLLQSLRPSGKVIYTKYSKHWPYTVTHTFECVCSKINHGLNHGLFISLLKLILCPIHWIVYV